MNLKNKTKTKTHPSERSAYVIDWSLKTESSKVDDKIEIGMYPNESVTVAPNSRKAKDSSKLKH